MSKQVTVKDWVDALRSDEYRQGKLVLRRIIEDSPDEFCCLGVLCQLIDPTEWKEDNVGQDGGVPYGSEYTGGGYTEWPPLPISDNLVVDEGWKVFNQRYFSGLNDEGKTFHEIADSIEQIYPLDKVIWSEDG